MTYTAEQSVPQQMRTAEALGRSVQCEVTCHDLHPACTGRYVVWIVTTRPHGKPSGREAGFDCHCECHRLERGP